jgi:ABC-2 type transport system ATP-binding protein
VLQRLDEAAVDVDELSIHTPDLDDVFFALTERRDPESPTPAPEETPTP